MAIKCILFDADGVVVDAEMFSVQYQKEYGVSNDEMLPFFSGEFQKCVVGQADLKEIIQPWLAKWKWEGTVAEFLQLWFSAEHSVDEQVAEVIKKLRKYGIRCYLATNQEKYRAQYLKEQMRFGKLFDGMFLSADIGFKKPSREFYEFILDDLENEYEIHPREIMFFDDDQKNVDKAKELGIDAHFYKNFEEFESILQTTFKSKISLR